MSTNRDQRLADNIKSDLLGLLQESIKLQEEIGKLTGLLATGQGNDQMFAAIQARLEIFDKKSSSLLEKHFSTLDAMPGVKKILENDPKDKKLIEQLKVELPKQIENVKSTHYTMMTLYQPEARTTVAEKEPKKKSDLGMFKKLKQKITKEATPEEKLEKDAAKKSRL
jgi:hypothetical protein